VKEVIAKYLVSMLVVSGLVTVAYGVPAAAHSGDCTVTGNTWQIGRDMYGSGNVDCGVVHSKMYIKVTLQLEENNGWNNLTFKAKSLPDVPSIYKQTSWGCQGEGGSFTYRVRIFYKVWNNGDLDHSDTVYKGQEAHPCIP
jgi:hypothetical protein